MSTKTDTVQPQLPPVDHFATVAQAKKSVAQLKPPVSDDQRNAFVRKLSSSQNNRQFAFKLLVPSALGKTQKSGNSINVVMDDLHRLLQGPNANLDPLKPDLSAEDVETWVESHFPKNPSAEDASRFLLDQSYLWPMLQIMRFSSGHKVFASAIASFANQMEGLVALAKPPKKSRRKGSGADFGKIVSLLIKKVPARPQAIGQFLELLLVCRAWALLPGNLQESLEDALGRNSRLASRLAEAQAERDVQSEARRQAETREAILHSELDFAKKQVSTHTDALTIQAGAHQSEKTGAVSNALAEIRRKSLPALENIRLYTEREAPNKEAILRAVRDLETFITQFKQD